LFIFRLVPHQEAEAARDRANSSPVRYGGIVGYFRQGASFGWHRNCEIQPEFTNAASDRHDKPSRVARGCRILQVTDRACA
ncbi:MAG TPA: hypothetical protein VLY63_13185, partial [Anaerolineae bacterium]|nr:hypothetical protein [Anaerolineae bacterium]